jgi:hypothetical protein
MRWCDRRDGCRYDAGRKPLLVLVVADRFLSLDNTAQNNRTAYGNEHRSCSLNPILPHARVLNWYRIWLGNGKGLLVYFTGSE